MMFDTALIFTHFALLMYFRAYKRCDGDAMQAGELSALRVPQILNDLTFVCLCCTTRTLPKAPLPTALSR